MVIKRWLSERIGNCRYSVFYGSRRVHDEYESRNTHSHSYTHGNAHDARRTDDDEHGRGNTYTYCDTHDVRRTDDDEHERGNTHAYCDISGSSSVVWYVERTPDTTDDDPNAACGFHSGH